MRAEIARCWQSGRCRCSGWGGTMRQRDSAGWKTGTPTRSARELNTCTHAHRVNASRRRRIGRSLGATTRHCDQPLRFNQITTSNRCSMTHGSTTRSPRLKSLNHLFVPHIAPPPHLLSSSLAPRIVAPCLDRISSVLVFLLLAERRRPPLFQDLRVSVGAPRA